MSNFPKQFYTKEQLGGVGVNLLRYKLSAAVTAAATTFPVSTNPTTFPALPDPTTTGAQIYMRIGSPGIDEEVIKVTSRDSSNIYVLRNIDGHGAHVHNIDDYVVYTFSAEIWNLVCDVLADIQSNCLMFSGITAEEIAPYDVVTYNSSGLIIRAKANALATSYIFGICQNGAGLGQTAFGLRTGIVTNNNWKYNALKKLWLSATEAGKLIEMEPDSGFSAFGGMSVTATKIDFRPELSQMGQLI